MRVSLSPRRRLEILILLVAVVASGLLSVYLGQDGNWDLRNYHYYNAYSFLNGRLNFDIAPAQLQSFYNPILDVPFYLIMNWFRPILYGFLVGALHGLNIWLVYKIVYSILVGLSERKRRILSMAAGLTGYLGAADVLEIGTSFHDNVTSLFVLAALFLVVTQSVRTPRGRVIAGGFLIGFAAGLKLVVAVYALPFMAGLLMLDDTLQRKLTNVVFSAASMMAGGALSMGFWLVELWRDFANPMFPYYNQIFKSPYYALTNIIDDRFFPRDKYQVLFYPFYFFAHSTLVSEESFRDIRLAMCYVSLLLLLFMTFYKSVMRSQGALVGQPTGRRVPSLSRAARCVLVFFVSAYVLWQAMFSIYRYLIPLELLAPAFVLLIVRSIFPFEKVLTRVSLGLFALIVVTMIPMGGWRRRYPWSASVVAVRVPAISRIARSTVILADDAPLSYVIPAFPATTRFVSVRNNFMSPAAHTKMQERVRKALERCGAGELFLMYRGKGKADYASVLAEYDLTMQTTGKLRVVTQFDDDLYLIPISRNGNCAPEGREPTSSPHVAPLGRHLYRGGARSPYRSVLSSILSSSRALAANGPFLTLRAPSVFA